MKIRKKLAEKFNLVEEETLTELITAEDSVKPSTAVVVVPATPIVLLDGPASGVAVVETDTALARATITGLMGRGVKSLDKLIQIADADENPRAYEVIALMLKTTADMSKDLLALQKLNRELSPADDAGGDSGGNRIQSQTNVFVGTTDDLLKAMAAIKVNKQLQNGEVTDAEIIEDPTPNVSGTN